MPRPTYLLAMLTTSLKFASQSILFASSSPFSILFASSISSSAVKRGTLPISLRYILTGSSTAIPFGKDASISISPASSTTRSTSSASASASASRSIISKSSGSISEITSTPIEVRLSYISSICSLSKSALSRKSATS